MHHLLATLLAAAAPLLDKPSSLPPQHRMIRLTTLYSGLVIAVVVGVVILMIARRIARRELASRRARPARTGGVRSAWEEAGRRAQPIDPDDLPPLAEGRTTGEPDAPAGHGSPR